LPQTLFARHGREVAAFDHPREGPHEIDPVHDRLPFPSSITPIPLIAILQTNRNG
jgi:hypothetical protein